MEIISMSIGAMIATMCLAACIADKQVEQSKRRNSHTVKEVA